MTTTQKSLWQAANELTAADQPNIRYTVPFFGVRDMDASLRFYVDGLGFTMTRHWDPDGRIRWCWLERDNASVMLQEFWNKGERPRGWQESCFTCRWHWRPLPGSDI